nr:hypothetical protein CFP56_38249 [Quercus suber]
MTPAPVAQDSECRLLMYKDYVVEMLESIIKDKDADPPVIPLTSSANPPIADAPLTQDAPDQTKGDGTPQDLPSS